MWWTSRLARLLCHLRASCDRCDGFVLHSQLGPVVFIYDQFIHPKHTNTLVLLVAEAGKQASVVAARVVLFLTS